MHDTKKKKQFKPLVCNMSQSHRIMLISMTATEYTFNMIESRFRICEDISETILPSHSGVFLIVILRIFYNNITISSK